MLTTRTGPTLTDATLIGDPAVRAVPVVDSGEPLVDLRRLGVACTAYPTAGEPARLVRLGLAGRLVAAQAALPAGVHLLVVEGWRSPAAQAAVIAGYTRRLHQAHPGLTRAEVERLSTRYVAPLDVAPHVAGAAVDVTLADEGGRQLWMGTAVDATPEDSGGACATAAAGLDAAARRHRAVLAAALGGAGLVNYPTEWWHWSWGDRYWAHTTGAATAWYGPVDAGPSA